MATSRARILKKKKKRDPILSPTGLNQAQNEIGYNDSLQQCVISSRGKIQEKKLGPKSGLNEQKLSQKLGFLPISQV